MLNILAIKGSPRPDSKSNSSLLLKEALEGIKDKSSSTDTEVKIKIISPASLDISPCRACNYCYKNGKCIIEDEMQQLYEPFNRADIIIVSTPVFFNGTPAQLKAMIDRCQAIWASKYKAKSSVIDRNRNRLGFLFATGGAPAYPEQFLAVQKVMEMFFRVINADYTGDLTVPDVDEDPVSEREDIMEKAYNEGQMLYG